MKPLLARKTLLASSITLTLTATNADAALVANVLGPYTWSTDSANFGLLYNSNGGAFGITNDVSIIWDGSAYNASSDYSGPGGVANVTASSTTLFLGYAPWTTHDIQMFAPGNYSFDVSLGGGNPETGTLSATVGAGQLGMHMLWDWYGNLNVDIFVVFDQNSIFGSGLLYSTQTNTRGQFLCDPSFTGTVVKNCLYDGPNYGGDGAPTKNQIWTLASADGNGDGIMGIPMAAGGLLEGFSWNVNANLTPSPIPIPAAAWLFGSGLLSLIGIAFRKKKTA